VCYTASNSEFFKPMLSYRVSLTTTTCPLDNQEYWLIYKTRDAYATAAKSSVIKTLKIYQSSWKCSHLSISTISYAIKAKDSAAQNSYLFAKVAEDAAVSNSSSWMLLWLKIELHKQINYMVSKYKNMPLLFFE